MGWLPGVIPIARSNKRLIQMDFTKIKIDKVSKSGPLGTALIVKVREITDLRIPPRKPSYKV